MVECKTCGKDVFYKNRFFNNCPNCNNKITHVCWKCKNEIDPTDKAAIELPTSHYHICPNCGSAGENDSIEQIKNMINDTNEYLIINKWYDLFPENNYAHLHQLTLNLLANNNMKYFCNEGISKGKPKKEFNTNTQFCDQCTFKKGKHKGKPLQLVQQRRNSTCNFKNHIAHYWSKEEKEE